MYITDDPYLDYDYDRLKFELIQTQAALEEKDKQIATLTVELVKEKALFKCYHCGFIATNKAEAEAHFGDGEGLLSLCKEWTLMDDAERADAYQEITMQFNQARDEEDRLTAEIERLRIKLDEVQRGVSHRSFIRHAPYVSHEEKKDDIGIQK